MLQSTVSCEVLASCTLWFLAAPPTFPALSSEERKTTVLFGSKLLRVSGCLRCVTDADSQCVQSNLRSGSVRTLFGRLGCPVQGCLVFTSLHLGCSRQCESFASPAPGTNAEVPWKGAKLLNVCTGHVLLYWLVYMLACVCACVYIHVCVCVCVCVLCVCVCWCVVYAYTYLCVFVCV